MRPLVLALAALAAAPALAAASPTRCANAVVTEVEYLTTGTAPTLRYVLYACDELLSA